MGLKSIIFGWLGSLLSGATGAALPDVLKDLGKLLVGKSKVIINLKVNSDFLGRNEIETFIEMLEHFYSTRSNLENGNAIFYKSFVESGYPDMRKVLYSCRNILDSLNGIKTTPELLELKTELVRMFETIKKVCNNVKDKRGFEEFKIKSMIESMEDSINKVENEDSKEELRKYLNEFKASQSSGCGTFADYVINLIEILDKSIANLIDNKENECVIYINVDNGKRHVNYDRLGINKVVIDKNSDKGYYDRESLLIDMINENNRKKSKEYIKKAIKMYNLSVEIHDYIKKLFYIVHGLYKMLGLQCVKETMDTLKKLLNGDHAWIYGASECRCSKYSNISGLRNDADAAMDKYIEGLLEQLCELKNNVYVPKESVDILAAKKYSEIIEDIYLQIKASKLLALKSYKNALEIEKIHGSQMKKIEKLVERCSDIVHKDTAEKIYKNSIKFSKKLRQVKTLEEYISVSNEYIDCLKRADDFKRKILSKFTALEKKVNKLIEEGNIGEDKFKNFNKLKEELEKLDLNKSFNLNFFIKLYKAAEKEVKKLEQLCKKQAKQREKGKPTNDENRLPLIPV